MNLEILNQLKKTVESDRLLETYNIMSGETATQEELDLALKPKKKSSILTIEKELLNSYCEAVSDMKVLLSNMIQNVADCKEMAEHVNSEFEPIITKHVDRIKNSGIWD